MFTTILNLKSVENTLTKTNLESDFNNLNLERQRIFNTVLINNNTTNNNANSINNSKKNIDNSLNSTTKLNQKESIPFYSTIKNSAEDVLIDKSSQSLQNQLITPNSFLHQPLTESCYEKISGSKCDEGVPDSKPIMSSVNFSSNQTFLSTIRNSITHSRSLSQSKNLSDSLGVKLVFKYENGIGKFVAVPTSSQNNKDREEDIMSKYPQNHTSIIEEKAEEIILGLSHSNKVVLIIRISKGINEIL